MFTNTIRYSSLNRIPWLESRPTMKTFHLIRRHLYVDRKRLQNPNIVKHMPTIENVKNNKFVKTKLIYVCGLGATGSLGLLRYHNPEKKRLEDIKLSDVSSGNFKRLRLFTKSDKILDVSCGYGFSIIAAEISESSHNALGFGLNSHSQIGYHVSRPGHPLEIVSTPSPIVLPTTNRIEKVACGRSHSILLDKLGQVFSLGNNSMGQCGRKIVEDEHYLGSRVVHKIEDLPSNIIELECGQDHSFFLSKDGKLFSCGWSADGQTGLGHYNNQSSPAQVKGDIDGAKIVKVSSYADTVMALDNEGNLFGWGNTEYGQFRRLTGIETEQFNLPRILKLKTVPGKIVDIAAGGTVMAVLNDYGQVYVWGFGILGCGPNVDQLSQPTLIPESLFGKNYFSPDTKVEKIYASLSHFAAITNKGELFCWGKNRSGCLGFNHRGNQFFPMRVDVNLAMVKKVALGVDHTCLIAEKVC